ncbi:MAG: DUF2851 family protein [Calditrichaeota bacterium]|nr:DUF2851 family protein [Calditrichota bacterium]
MNKINEPARESFLYKIWLDRTFGELLATVDGRKIEIREKGVRNFDAGPDFLNALVLLEGKMVRGDIEIHPIAGDWFSHGHHHDPRYNNVILHVVTMSCPPDFRTLRQDGQIIPTLNLDQFLEKTAEELENDPEFHVDAASPVICALSVEDDNKITRILERAGEARLALKVNRFVERRQTDSWDQIFYQSIFEALGYSKNQIPFRNLAQKLPLETLWDYLWNDPPNIARSKAEAYLMGAAGLLPSQSVAKETTFDAEIQNTVDELENYWRNFPLQQKIDHLHAEAWRFFRLRPQNFPTRRIAAAAVYVLRFLNDGFVGSIEKVVLSCEKQPIKAIRELAKLFFVEAEGFWHDHYCFDQVHLNGVSAQKDQAIVGQDRAKDIVVNVVIPGMIAYAGEADDGRLRIAMKEIYAQFPRLSENEVTRFMRKQLFGQENSGPQQMGVRHQQGLIHLNKSLCRPDRCNACLGEDVF